MSGSKFAPITANLLARKGAAVPTQMTGAIESLPRRLEPVRVLEEFSQHDEHDERPALHELAQHDAHPHDAAPAKKLFVSLSHGEYERLAIAAVKTGLSRHQLIRDALDCYFEQLVRDIGTNCRCVSGCAEKCS